MLIDCDTCGNRGAGCSGCLVTALLDSDPADLGPIAIVECDFPYNPRPCPAPPGTR